MTDTAVAVHAPEQGARCRICDHWHPPGTDVWLDEYGYGCLPWCGGAA